MPHTDLEVLGSTKGLIDKYRNKKPAYKKLQRSSATFEVADDCFLSCRVVKVEDATFVVPKYIYRFDSILKNGKKASCGWRLHYKKTIKFYSDNKHASAELSLEHAKNDLQQGYVIKDHKKIADQPNKEKRSRRDNKPVYQKLQKSPITFQVADGCFLNCRVIKVKGKNYVVPRHINRVDIVLENGKKGTHGWQLRYKKISLLYSDSKQSSIKLGLEKAKNDLRRGYIVKDHVGIVNQKLNKKNLSNKKIKLIPGVNIASSTSPKSLVKHYNVVCRISVYNGKARQFTKYLSVKDRLTQEKLNDALDIILTLRKYSEYLYKTKQADMAEIIGVKHITPLLIKEYRPKIKYPTIKQITQAY